MVSGYYSTAFVRREPVIVLLVVLLSWLRAEKI